jgi:glycosyltransferase involved in cell wall biosynthesis
MTGDRIRVLYHGAVWEHRGLEACIRSVASWRSEFDFTIRGPISEAYRASLEAEIAAAGVRGRVHIVPPVTMTALVTEASAFDIGLFALPGHSEHNQYALPNKFFEYTMAGLALCVSRLPEMARLIERYRHGLLLDSLEPDHIARAINSLDAASIDRLKRNSMEAARELCWEREQVEMLDAYRAVVSRSMASGFRDSAAHVI